jgi:pSer/pThr/pTyr-binding forkhead associated (FHA) protein
MGSIPRFQITEAGRPERTVELTGTATIGRDSDNDIVLDEITVSRCHALLLTDAAGTVLLDLDSTNGTFVNGEPAPPERQVCLKDGDLIQIGTVLLRYVASSAAHVAARPVATPWPAREPAGYL